MRGCTVLSLPLSAVRVSHKCATRRNPRRVRTCAHMYTNRISPGRIYYVCCTTAPCSQSLPQISVDKRFILAWSAPNSCLASVINRTLELHPYTWRCCGDGGSGGGGERVQATAACRRINSSAQFILFFSSFLLPLSLLSFFPRSMRSRREDRDARGQAWPLRVVTGGGGVTRGDTQGKKKEVAHQCGMTSRRKGVCSADVHAS